MDLAKEKISQYVHDFPALGKLLTDNSLHPGNPLTVLNVLARTVLHTVHLPAQHQISLGAMAPIISGHMLNTLRIQSISDHNVSSGQKSDTFKMYPVM